jgi:hypothetical protein
MERDGAGVEAEEVGLSIDEGEEIALEHEPGAMGSCPTRSRGFDLIREIAGLSVFLGGGPDLRNRALDGESENNASKHTWHGPPRETMKAARRGEETTRQN